MEPRSDEGTAGVTRAIRAEPLVISRQTLTAAEVAVLTSMSTKAVYRGIPGFPEPIRLGRSLRWKRAEVEAFLGSELREGAA